MRLDTSFATELLRLKTRRMAASTGLWPCLIHSSLRPLALTLGVLGALFVHGDVLVRLGILLVGFLAAMGAEWLYVLFLARHRRKVAPIDAEIAALFDQFDVSRPRGEER